MAYLTDIGMRVVTCSCGLTWAAPEKWFKDRENDHKTFYCPNGCPRWFRQDNEKERLKKLLKQEQQCCIAAREEANHLEKRLWGYKGYAAKINRKLKAMGS